MGDGTVRLSLLTRHASRMPPAQSDIKVRLLRRLAPQFSLNIISEVFKYSVLQNFSQPWINPDLDIYVTGVLSMGYHASWITLMRRLGDYTEPISFKASEPAVFCIGGLAKALRYAGERSFLFKIRSRYVLPTHI